MPLRLPPLLLPLLLLRPPRLQHSLIIRRPTRHYFTTMTTSIDIQATQDTLKVLQTIGLDLSWDESHQIAHPTGSQAALIKKEGAEAEEKSLSYLSRLASLAQTVSARHLVSSLLAGPDNEADDSLDIPLFLGHPSTSLNGSNKTETLDWVLGQLGLGHLDHAQLTIREPFDDGQRITPQSSLDQPPWVLNRLSESQAIQTSTADPDRTALEQLLARLRPRLSLEIEVSDSCANRPVCLLVGPIPDSLSHSWGGLISYRVST
ncbi:hypothetical protein PGT21_011829 [Puccinia graminis f. sp. tritici]|nr:hypothetical protein PGT21_011829 [Puccinia graminis f. sp. tritici]